MITIIHGDLTFIRLALRLASNGWFLFVNFEHVVRQTDHF